MKRILLAVLGLGLFMVSASVALAGKPDNPVRESYTMLVAPDATDQERENGVIFDPCVPERIQFEGFKTTLQREVGGPSQKARVSAHTNVSQLQGTGQGSIGGSYVGVGSQNEEITFSDGKMIISGVYNGPIIQKGVGIISEMHVRVTLTFDLDDNGDTVGEPAVEFAQDREGCDRLSR